MNIFENLDFDVWSEAITSHLATSDKTCKLTAKRPMTIDGMVVTGVGNASNFLKFGKCHLIGEEEFFIQSVKNKKAGELVFTLKPKTTIHIYENRAYRENNARFSEFYLKVKEFDENSQISALENMDGLQELLEVSLERLELMELLEAQRERERIEELELTMQRRINNEKDFGDW